jgi:hypothetical protein
MFCRMSWCKRSVNTYVFFRTFSSHRIVVTTVPGRLIHRSMVLLLWLFNGTVSTLRVLYISRMRLESNVPYLKSFSRRGWRKPRKTLRIWFIGYRCCYFGYLVALFQLYMFYVALEWDWEVTVPYLKSFPWRGWRKPRKTLRIRFVDYRCCSFNYLIALFQLTILCGKQMRMENNRVVLQASLLKGLKKQQKPRLFDS